MIVENAKTKGRVYDDRVPLIQFLDNSTTFTFKGGSPEGQLICAEDF
jgi:hypothetical protein